MMFCSKCGREIIDTAVVCTNCGSATENFKKEQASEQPVINILNNNVNSNTNTVNGMAYPQKSKVVAALLCFFLGCLGIHRFYVGKIGTGIIWLLTLGFWGIGALIDFIMIIVGAFRDKAGMPLK